MGFSYGEPEEISCLDIAILPFLRQCTVSPAGREWPDAPEATPGLSDERTPTGAPEYSLTTGARAGCIVSDWMDLGGALYRTGRWNAARESDAFDNSLELDLSATLHI